MNVRRFLSDHQEVDGRILLTGDELHHLRTVNRAGPSDPIEIVNGRGDLYTGIIHSISNREAVVEITAHQHQEKPPVSVIIAPSITKKRGMTVMIEKLSEMGVDEIRPVVFGRTDEKFGANSLDKWRRVAFQALKVNRRLWPTEILPPVLLPELIKEVAHVNHRLLLHIDGNARVESIDSPVIAVIGPPGDFLDEERETLLSQGFQQIKINDCILKTETAAISIAAVLKMNII